MSTPSRAIAGLALAILTASVGTSAANVALPALVTAFTATPGQVQWVVIAYLLAITSVSVAAGSAGDRWGRRRVLLAGIALFTVGAAVGALAPSLVTLIIARAIQGFGAAIMTALPLALAKDLVANGRTGRIMGLLGTTSAVGTALGPALGGVLVGWGGWASPFWMMALLGATALPFALMVPSARTIARPRHRFDAVGNVLLSAGIATYALALTAPVPNWPTGPLLIGAAALVIGFLAVERRADAPVFPPAMLRHRTIRTGMITNVLVATVMMTTLVVGPYALHDGLQLPLPLVGLVMSVGPVTSAISGVLAGRLVDRTSPPVMISLSLTILSIGTAALATLPAWWGVAGYVGALVILTPGYQLFLAANNTHTLGATDAEQRGTVAGALGLSRNLGLITGASAMAALYTSLTAGADTAASGSLDATRSTFLIATLLAAIAAVTSLLPSRALRATPRKEHP
ncbi:MFS transporter [Microbacterium sp. Clip185]|uniref:MFS transporter n=1 Tax=Microbacterium sp. Clip185 TaxID=3025663 RepID=UPI002366D700|nr:MFS transporter [Microbacterium sp. Clip185]WDG19253.1 MFS transporter [Microbacterium sp. Clip185]